ncbi:MAG: gfo/Idh/MocA family oxidoreductase, partial [Roseicyclus sp.]
MSPRFAILGIDHRHVYGMAGHLIEAGASCAGWWTEGSPATLDGFHKRFPDLPRAARWQDLVEDPS